jgi:hypothetical protein
MYSTWERARCPPPGLKAGLVSLEDFRDTGGSDFCRAETSSLLGKDGIEADLVGTRKGDFTTSSPFRNMLDRSLAGVIYSMTGWKSPPANLEEAGMKAFFSFAADELDLHLTCSGILIYSVFPKR